MPRKNWWCVNTWVNLQEQIAAIVKKYENWSGTPKYLAINASTMILRAVLKDQEEELHSLIQSNTCSCGLRLKKSDNPLAMVESKYHRNQKTLELELDPRFRV